MRIDDQQRSSNIEDRRGMSVGRGVAGGGIGIVVIALIAMFFGVDPGIILQGGASSRASRRDRSSRSRRKPRPAKTRWPTSSPPCSARPRRSGPKSSRAAAGPTASRRWCFSPAQVQSACGYAQAAVGPFYCPADQKLYIDLAFYRDLQDRFRAPGDFAQAYVIAHEVGHHVQNLLGIAERVHGMQQRAGKQQANALVGADGAAGRLLRRGLGGAREPEASDPRAGRRRGGSGRRGRGRRRPHPDGVARLRRRRSRSPTAARSSACAGSGAGSTPATSRPATHSPPRSSDLVAGSLRTGRAFAARWRDPRCAAGRRTARVRSTNPSFSVRFWCGSGIVALSATDATLPSPRVARAEGRKRPTIIEASPLARAPK